MKEYKARPGAAGLGLLHLPALAGQAVLQPH